MIVLGCYNFLLFCDSEDAIPFWREDNVEVKKKFVIKIDFIIESGRILTKIM